MRFFLLFAAVIICAADPVRADEFDARSVSADAQWVAHVDVDTLRATQAAEQYLKPLLASEQVGRELKNIRAAIGIDLTADLHGATLYGVPFEPRRGVVVARADLIKAAFTEFLATQPDYKITKYEIHELHWWTDRHHKGTVIACVLAVADGSTKPSSRTRSLVVIAHHPADMHKALDVLDGKSPSLAESQSPLATEIRAAAGNAKPVLTIGVCGLGKAQLPLKSPIVRQCETFAMTLGESDAKVALHARLVADSEASAADMDNVVRGLIALGRLSADSNEPMRKVLDAVSLGVEGRTVVMKWSGHVVDVFQAFEQEWMKRNMPR